ncbi:MAG: YlbF family regulator [Clostridia bacterium]|nr:YlbF family regulator [Clostridia bacterium]
MSMDMVFQKTRELGQALMECDVYQNMKAAEDKAMKNPEAAETMGLFMEKRGKLEELVSSDDFDAGEMKRLSNEMDDLQQRLQMMDDIVKMTEARNEFSQLMGQVNQVLQFIITGQIEESVGGCTGSCASCGGSCRKN